ncbi:hypothetical protein ACLB2K_075235 [Fragaria x ananassa]
MQQQERASPSEVEIERNHRHWKSQCGRSREIDESRCSSKLTGACITCSACSIGACITSALTSSSPCSTAKFSTVTSPTAPSSSPSCCSDDADVRSHVTKLKIKNPKQRGGNGSQ